MRRSVVRNFGVVESVIATATTFGKVGFGMFCLVAASDLKDAYCKNPAEENAFSDYPETRAVPYSLRMRQQKFAYAAQAAIAQDNPNQANSNGILPLQYVIANKDIDGLLTLARKGLVITPEAIEMAKINECSENFVGVMQMLYKLQNSSKEKQPVLDNSDDTPTFKP